MTTTLALIKQAAHLFADEVRTGDRLDAAKRFGLIAQETFERLYPHGVPAIADDDVVATGDDHEV